MRRLKQTGFTLIELVVSMAVVGILTSVAVPAYRNSVMKSHRADAIVALAEIAQLQERFFSEKNTYTNNLFSTSSATNACRGIIYTAPSGYTLAVSTSTAPVIAFNGGSGSCTVTTMATDFSVTATTTGTQADDHQCTKLTIDSLGVTSSKDHTDTASDCW